ncbi:MAG TPA: DUF5989 family protein [Planctomycetota bacterium]|nr:DUF5989 family protein [Planctomycetota bacterium]
MTLARDFVLFLRTEKKWWLLPLVLFAAGLLVAAWLTESPPSFVYAIF